MPHVMALAGVLTPGTRGLDAEMERLAANLSGAYQHRGGRTPYAPREWAKGAFRALKPGGRLICTTIKAQRARKLESISRKLDIAV